MGRRRGDETLTSPRGERTEVRSRKERFGATPSSALRAPSPPLGEKDGMRGLAGISTLGNSQRWALTWPAGRCRTR